MDYRQHMTGLILAGGRSSRMGGEDKAWMNYKDKPMIEQVLHRLRPQVGDVLISANRNVGQYQQLGFRVIGDEFPGHPGPLAGIAAALASCETDWLLVSACDAPNTPKDLAQRLWNGIRRCSNEVKLAYPHDGEQTQHLFMLLHRDCLAALEESLKNDQHKVMQWVSSQSPIEVNFSDHPTAFTNINTPYELEH